MKVPRLIVPILVLVALAVGIFTRTSFTYPSSEVLLADPEGKTLERVAFTVQGVKCKGTANFFAERFRGVGGVVMVTAYADEHRAIITYEPSRIGPDSLRRVFEAPVIVEGERYDSVFVWRGQEKVD